VLACPAILAERPLELRRKAAFLTDALVMSLADALAWPGFYAASLMQVGCLACFGGSLSTRW
jgi:hypothetical protein